MADVLDVRGLSVARGPRVLLDDVSFTADAGQVVAVLGPNGAGKSTLLKTLAGLLPFSGQVLLHGQSSAALSLTERARTIAYVPQHSALDAALPARDVIAHGRFAHRDSWGRPSSGDAAAITRAMDLTDTHRLAQRPFCKLSYGERRLVLLARALCTEARILLLDEPTAALDVAHALNLLHVLRALADQGCLILVALHQLNEAAEACDRALLLSQARLQASGEIADVIAAEPVRRIYGVELVPGAHFGYRRGGQP